MSASEWHKGACAHGHRGRTQNESMRKGSLHGVDGDAPLSLPPLPATQLAMPPAMHLMGPSMAPTTPTGVRTMGRDGPFTGHSLTSHVIQRKMQENEWKRQTIANRIAATKATCQLESAGRGAGGASGMAGGGGGFSLLAGGEGTPASHGGGTNTSTQLQLQVLTDEYLALLLQNEEFLTYLRRDQDFMHTLERGIRVSYLL